MCIILLESKCEVIQMSNVKNPKHPNPRGSVNVAIGDLMSDVKAIAEKENRSVNRQVVVIIREWIEQRKTTEHQAHTRDGKGVLA